MKRISTDYILAAVIGVAVAAAYITSFHGVFLFDDAVAIFRNPGVIGETAVFSGHRFLVDLAFRVNWMMSGDAACSYHAVNLVIHIAAVLFLYGIVRRTLSRFMPGEEYWARSAAVAVALIWGLHPLCTQAVTYVCQRYESMMGMCMLGAMYCFVRGCAGRHARLWCDASLLLLLLGMGCKEVMAVAPILLLAYDYVFCAKSVDELVRKRGLFHVAGFLLLLVVVLFEVQFAGRYMLLAEPRDRVGVVAAAPYLYTQAQVILRYMALSLWPVDLCFDYAWEPRSYSAIGMLPVLFHAMMAGASLLFLVRRKWYGFVGVAFYLVLAPTSSVIPVADIAVEHRMYIPLVAIVAILVLSLLCVVRGKLCSGLHEAGRRRLFLVTLLAVATMLGIRTALRNMDYWSELTMWQDVVSKNPDNLRARNDLAASLSEHGSTDAAVAEYNEVLARIPVDLRNQLDRGEAMVFGSFRQPSPEYAYFVACANLATMYCNELRDYDAAFDWYLRALRVAPYSPKVRRSAMNLLRAFGHSDDELAQALNDAIRVSISKAKAE